MEAVRQSVQQKAADELDTAVGFEVERELIRAWLIGASATAAAT
jgi:hypothetical protein